MQRRRRHLQVQRPDVAALVPDRLDDMQRFAAELRHGDRFAGEPVTLKLRVPMENRRRLNGQLVGLEGDAVKLIVDGTELSVDLRNVELARLKPMV